MPMFIGKEQKKKELINNLEETYKQIQKDFCVPAGQNDLRIKLRDE